MFRVFNIRVERSTDSTDDKHSDDEETNEGTYYITVNGFGHICEVLTKNKTLKKLNIGNNTQITSTTTSLLELYLQNTSLEDDNIMTICHTLTTNKIIERLVLSKKYRRVVRRLRRSFRTDSSSCNSIYVYMLIMFIITNLHFIYNTQC